MVFEHSDEFEVEGNGCEKGTEFARAEAVDPTRSLTTTVRTTLPGVPVLPVRTDGEIPKDMLQDAMRVLSSVIVSRELNCGDSVLENVAGSGVRVIATSDMLRKPKIINQDIQIGSKVDGTWDSSEFGVTGFRVSGSYVTSGMNDNDNNAGIMDKDAGAKDETGDAEAGAGTGSAARSSGHIPKSDRRPHIKRKP